MVATTLTEARGYDAPRRPVRALVVRRPEWLVVAVVVALRLPFLGHPASSDEAGFSVIASQWHAGSSLYGDFWVDRPPLLITLFDLADHTGGLVSLRLLGTLAAALTVLGVARVTQRLGGPTAACWAAVTAGALISSPLLGTGEVDGELLSAPFVAWGLVAVLRAVDRARLGPARPGQPAQESSGLGGVRRAALAAGAALTASLLVKQNVVDVGVFAAVLLLVAWRTRELTAAQAARVAGWGGVGALATLAAAATWTAAHGTSLGGVFYAMYPFRVRAAHLIAISPHQGSSDRLVALLAGWAASGGALLLALALTALLVRRLRGAAPLALGAVLVYDAFSVLAGASYWNHYLVQLVVPVAVLTGLLATRERGGWALPARLVVGLAGLSAAVALVVATPVLLTSQGVAIGEAIATAARPGDSIVTVYGHAEVTGSSGLASPYPYLWSLPAKTLDPDLSVLTDTLAGPRAPTWFVTWGHLSSWGVDDTRAAAVLAARYRPVADLLGRTVYLRDDTVRPTPTLP